MPDYITPEQLAISWNSFDKNINDATRKLFIGFGRDLKAAARAYSRGGLSYRDLAKMGHPYATSHSAASGNTFTRGRKKGRVKDPNAASAIAQSLTGANAAEINKHSAVFLNSWHWRTSSKGAEPVTGTLSNDAEKNGFRYGDALFTGTNRMIARPTLAEALFQANQRGIDGQFDKFADLVGDLVIGNIVGSSGFKRS